MIATETRLWYFYQLSNPLGHLRVSYVVGAARSWHSSQQWHQEPLERTPWPSLIRCPLLNKMPNYFHLCSSVSPSLPPISTWNLDVGEARARADEPLSWAGWVPGLAHFHLSQLWVAMGTLQDLHMWGIVTCSDYPPGYSVTQQGWRARRVQLSRKCPCPVPVSVTLLWGSRWYGRRRRRMRGSCHFWLSASWFSWTGSNAMLVVRLWALREDAGEMAQGPPVGVPVEELKFGSHFIVMGPSPLATLAPIVVDISLWHLFICRIRHYNY